MQPRIFLFDTDPAFSALVRRRLLAAGYAIEAASELDDAVAILTQRSFAGIVVAAGPGDDDALVLGAEARDIYGDRIAMLAYGATDTSSRLRAYRCGFDDVIAQPAEAETIAQRLDAALAQLQFRRDILRCGGAPGARYLLVGRLPAEGPIAALHVGLVLSDSFRLAVDAGSQGQGSIWIKDESIIGAECGPLRGDAALKALYAFNDGAFRLYEEKFFGRAIDKPIPEAPARAFDAVA